MDLRSTTTMSNLPRQFWYFAAPDRPIEVRLERRGDEPNVEGALLVDVSCCHPPTTSFGGVRILTPSMLRYDEPVGIDLRCVDPTLTLRVDAIVRTIRAGDSPATWLTGCVFAEALSVDGLDRWVDAGWLTRRSHARLSVLLSASAVWEGGRRTPEIELSDLGYGGFCVRSTTPATIGSRVQIQVKERDCQVQLLGEVRWLTRTNDGYLVGCMFTGTNMSQTVNKIIDFYKSIIADDEDGDDVTAAACGAQPSRPGWLTMSRWWSRDADPQT
ncbi:MAG: PilZ domain-containing protein [Pirellulales bacterium]